MFNEFWGYFMEGMQGKNKGLPIGFSRIEKYLNGIHRGRYYTLFSEGGTGKSAFTWAAFIISPLDFMIEFNKKLEEEFGKDSEVYKKKKLSVKIKLYSLEVVRKEVIAKMVCLKIFKEYGLIVSPDYVLNRISDYPVTKTVMALVKSYESYFKMIETEGYLEIIDKPRTPSQIRKEITQFANDNGKFEKTPRGQKYLPKNPDEFVIVITDTVGNLMTEPVDGRTSVKTTIDVHSANCRSYYRDTLNYIPINISHSNRSMSDMSRAKMGEVFPKLSDIKETNMLEQDSSVVMTIFNPMNHISSVRNLEGFMGYDIKSLKERFRCLGILKNRHGEVNKRVGLMFLGECGYFNELELPGSMLTGHYQKVLSYKSARYLKEEVMQKVIHDKNPEVYSMIKSFLETLRKKREEREKREALKKKTSS